MLGIWGYNSPTASTFDIANWQKAYRLGRQYPGYSLQEPVEPSEGDPDGLTIVPIHAYTFPLPEDWEEDEFGVAYPAGTLVVVNEQGLLRDLAGDYNSEFEYFWKERRQDLLGGWLVPGVLPEGYTPQGPLWRSHREHEYISGSSFDPMWYDASGFFSHGIIANPWPPSDGIGSELDTFPVVWTGTLSGSTYNGPDVNYNYSQTTGFRYVSYRIVTTNVSPSTFTGNIDITLSHNADGSDPGSGDGDTIDFTDSVDVSTLTFIPGVGVTNDWQPVGPILAALGVITHFHLRIGSTGINGSGLGPLTITAKVQFQLSPRVDVPWPTTVMGIGNLIAPGGIVT
jgi:hypothetical protein